MTPHSVGAFPGTSSDMRKKLQQYMIRWIRNPDPGSIFEKKTRWIRWMHHSILIPLLVCFGYGGKIFVKNGAIEGHVFYQCGKQDLRIFSVFSRIEKRGTATEMIRVLLVDVWEHTDTKRVRISAGGDPAIRRIWVKVLEGRVPLPFTPKEAQGVGWIIIPR